MSQGWTKFTKFDNLDALSEAEWDKVRILSGLWNPRSGSLIRDSVLGCQLQRKHASFPKSIADSQIEP